MKVSKFLSELDDGQISAAIAEAEKRTSGEIRVFVTKQEVVEIIPAAEKEFINLGMTATKQRNGVLIYFAPKSRAYAILGDKGVHEKCGLNFWEQISRGMEPLLKAEKFTEAILLAVREAGEALAKHFPWKAGDVNELPNTVGHDDEK